MNAGSSRYGCDVSVRTHRTFAVFVFIQQNKVVVGRGCPHFCLAACCCALGHSNCTSKYKHEVDSKMELPFAVESPTHDSDLQGSSNLGQSDSSLVTASSQGSFLNGGQLLDGPLPPNTPQDVVLPRYENRQQQPSVAAQQTHPTSHPPHPPILSGPISSGSRGEQDEPEIIDFTYVNVSEDDADDADEDVGILLEGGDLNMHPETQRGDILAVLLSGIQHAEGNEAILVSSFHI